MNEIFQVKRKFSKTARMIRQSENQNENDEKER